MKAIFTLFTILILTGLLGAQKISTPQNLYDLKPLSNVYESLESKTIETPDKKNNDDDKIVIGGGTKIVMTKEQFISLKQEIKKIRNKITKNN